MRSWLRTPIPAVLVHLLLEWNTYLLFNSDIVNFVWKTDEGGGSRKHYFVDFCSLALLQSSVGEGLWVGAESLIKGQLKSHFFPAGI